MRTKIIFTFFVFLLLVYSASAIKVENTECRDDGSFEITLKANSDKYAYTKEMIMSADGKRVKGSWDNDQIRLTSSASDKYATFSGLENQLREKKNYAMKIIYKLRTETSEEDAELTFDIECPGLLFTCKKIGIRVNDCLTSKSGKFTSNMDIYGLEQSERAKLDPFEVIDFILDAQILYRDINDRVSKRGSLPKDAVIKKVAENKYLIEANFDKYTTNHAKYMWVKFNDNLPRVCNPSDYPDIVLTYKKECEYKETEEDWLAEQEEKEDLVLGSLPTILEETPVEQLRDSVYNEINELEAKRAQIESRLNELYQKKDEISTVDESSAEEIQEEPKNTGYSIKSSDIEGSSKKADRLKILLVFLFGVIVVGGVLLTYLYKQGYFY